MKIRPLIIGIDTGTTSAVAVFDLRGRLQGITGAKGFSQPDIISYVSSIGKPLIVATDKRKPSATINKIAAAFSARLFVPDSDISVQDKEQLTGRVTTKNLHERDAASAALVAYRAYADGFSKIDKTLEEQGLENLSEQVKELILTKRAKNTAEAIAKLTEKPVPVSGGKVIEHEPDWKEVAEQLKKKLKEQERSLAILKEYGERMKSEKEKLENWKQNAVVEERKKTDAARRALLREKEIVRRDTLLKQLESELGRMRDQIRAYQERDAELNELKQIETEGLVGVIPVEQFTRDSLMETQKEVGITNRVIWIKNYRPSASAAKYLLLNKPRAIIFPELPEELELLRAWSIPIVTGITPQQRHKYAVVPSADLTAAMKETERKSFVEWLANYKKR